VKVAAGFTRRCCLVALVKWLLCNAFMTQDIKYLLAFRLMDTQHTACSLNGNN